MSELMLKDPSIQETTNPVDSLGKMKARLDSILGCPLTEDALVEITSIYNNVAYLFLYLEANSNYVDFTPLLPWRSAFHADKQLDDLLSSRLADLVCQDPEVEDSRVRLIEQLREKRDERNISFEAEAARLLSECRTTTESIESNLCAFLNTLGVPCSPPNAALSLYRLTTNVGDLSISKKIAASWASRKRPLEKRLFDSVNALISHRRRHATQLGFKTALDKTFIRCRVEKGDVYNWLAGYIKRAIQAHRLLETEIQLEIGDAEQPMQHFGRFIRSKFGNEAVPLFNLESCLQFAFAVAEAIFNLKFVKLSGDTESAVCYGVWSAREKLGEINFDLWDSHKKIVPANHMLGIRNRTSWGKFLQLPVAYVSCRFKRREGKSVSVTFQNVHSIFHEFGHALNHILMRKRISNSSGLEYLPLERLECMSMWFEKWVYHPELGDFLDIKNDEKNILRRCQKIKFFEYKRTLVERAVMALLDFEVHAHEKSPLEEIFKALDTKFGISPFCQLEDFPHYFTWPNALANPGANFCYLFGAADSCEKYIPYKEAPLKTIAGENRGYEMFASSLDFNERSHIPSVDAVYELYVPNLLK